MTPWLQSSPIEQPVARVCCLPRAGGSARDFDHWGPAFGPEVQVLAVQLPGRLTRFREPALTAIPDLVKPLGAALSELAPLPVVLVGDCMGSLAAFELARTLREEHGRTPVALVVASYEPPDRVRTTRPYHDATPDELRSRLAEVGGAPQEILENDELFELMLPTLRADFSLFETYQYQPQKPLACDINAIVGADDPYVSTESLAGWGRHTSEDFQVQAFPGGHFFLRDSVSALKHIREIALSYAT